MKDNDLKKLLENSLEVISLENFNNKVFEELKNNESTQNKKEQNRSIRTFNNSLLFVLMVVITTLVSMALIYGQGKVAVCVSVSAVILIVYFISTDCIINKKINF